MTHGYPEQKESVDVKERPKTRKPPLFRVFLLNDDYTTMEFVVSILEEIFHKNPVEATGIMLHVHKQGKGLAGIFERQIAEAKMAEVHDRARAEGFPLRCTMEKE